MTGQADNGFIYGFNMSEKQLEEVINEYKSEVESGVIINPCPPQFFDYIGVNRDIVRTVIVAGAKDRSTYRKRAEMLKSALQWLRGEMASEVHWQGNKSIKTMFLLKQDWGDGITLEDKPDPKARKGSKSFNVSWGSPPEDSKSRKRK